MSENMRGNRSGFGFRLLIVTYIHSGFLRGKLARVEGIWQAAVRDCHLRALMFLTYYNIF